ncbi:MAG: agmatine deiminase, partial [Candidatus Cloacimonetes bacterium]|nr:agmatine deiminase [Candidatus Cloacimonadota bacterium]
MKRTLMLTMLLILVLSLCAERISLGDETNSLILLSNSDHETILEYRINQFDTSEVKIKGQTWHHISLPGEGFTQDKALPQLPVFNRSIIIDNSARMNLEVFDVQFTDLKLAVAPSKGVITRDVNPDSVPYEFSNVYLSNSFYPNELATLSDPYILRDFRGITVQTTPFAYKPDTQTLRVYTSYKVRIYND